MSSIKSNQKISAFRGITDATKSYVSEVNSEITALKNATEDIKIPVFDNLYNRIAMSFNNFNEFIEELGGTMSGICNKYADRDGFGQTARAEFEDCSTYVKTIGTEAEKFTEVEVSTGLDENLTEDTVAAFTRALEATVGAKTPYMNKIVAVVDEHGEEDSMEIYTNIGAGVEQLANSLVDIFEENSAAISKFGVSLEEATTAIKSQSSTVADSGKSTAMKMQASGEDLM